MTLEIVQSRLDKLLAEETPKVAMLTGDWGSGKTYQWKQALERVPRKGGCPRYAYVSLFGLTSLAEVRKRITEPSTESDGLLRLASDKDMRLVGYRHLFMLQ